MGDTDADYAITTSLYYIVALLCAIRRKIYSHTMVLSNQN